MYDLNFENCVVYTAIQKFMIWVYRENFSDLSLNILITQFNYLFLSELIIKTFLYLIFYSRYPSQIYQCYFQWNWDYFNVKMNSAPSAKNLQQMTPTTRWLVITDNLITVQFQALTWYLLNRDHLYTWSVEESSQLPLSKLSSLTTNLTPLHLSFKILYFIKTTLELVNKMQSKKIPNMNLNLVSKG